MDTCSVSFVIIETCDTTICASWVVVFFASGVASIDFCQLLVVRLVFMELIAIFTVDTESVTSLSTLIFFLLAGITSIGSASQYSPSSLAIATFSILLLLLHTHSSLGSNKHQLLGVVQWV